MKTVFLSLALSATALMAITQTATAQTSNVTAIKAVIERETTAWNSRDASAMTACWANVPEAGQLVSLQDGKGTTIANYNDKTEMPQGIETMIAEMGKPTGETFQNTDYRIRVTGNAAFAQFDQVATVPGGPKVYFHETRYLEKTKGDWKIVHVGAVGYQPTAPAK